MAVLLKSEHFSTVNTYLGNTADNGSLAWCSQMPYAAFSYLEPDVNSDS